MPERWLNTAITAGLTLLLAAAAPSHVGAFQASSTAVQIRNVTRSDAGVLTIVGLNFRHAATGTPHVRVNGVAVAVSSSNATTVITGPLSLTPGAYNVRVTQTYIGNSPRTESWATDDFEITVGATGAPGPTGPSTTFLGYFSGSTYEGSPTGCTTGGAAYLGGNAERAYVCNGLSGLNGAPGADSTLASLSGIPCTLPGDRTGTTSVRVNSAGLASMRCDESAAPAVPSGFFSIGSRSGSGPYLMVDLLPCLSAGIDVPCGRLNWALGADLQNEQQSPSYFKYDFDLDTLQYFYDGPYLSLASGTWCLVALNASLQECSVSDCSEIRLVRTQANSCEAVPNARRFQAKFDNPTSTIVVIVSSSNTATQPSIILKSPTGQPVVSSISAGDYVTQWRFEFPVP